MGTYSTDDLQAMHLAQWRDDDFALFTYPPKWRERYEPPNDTTRLILDLKAADATAITTVATWMTAAMRPHLERIRDELRCRYLVAAPTSSPARMNAGCESLCDILAGTFGFLEHLPGALARTADIQPSHRGGNNSVEDHAATIAYVGRIPTGGADARYCAEHDKHFRTDSGFAWHLEHNAHERGASTSAAYILVDDVITNGRTSAACRRAIIEATGTPTVVGLFAGRTYGH